MQMGLLLDPAFITTRLKIKEAPNEEESKVGWLVGGGKAQVTTGEGCGVGGVQNKRWKIKRDIPRLQECAQVLTPVCLEIRSVEGEKDKKDTHPPPRWRSNLCCSHAPSHPHPTPTHRTSNPTYISFTNLGSTYLFRHNKSQLLCGTAHLFRLFFPWRSRRRTPPTNTTATTPPTIYADRECLCSITFYVPSHYRFTHRAENKTLSPFSLWQRK